MRRNQGVTIAALIIAIVGLSIGFAAFSNTLTIRSSASVTPDESNFQVKFSKVSNADQTGTSYPITPIIPQGSDATGDNGIISESNPLTLTGLKANFTSPGEYVSYKLYVRNTGHYTAYLTNLDFKDIIGGEDFIECSGNDVSTNLRRAACDDISVSVTIGGTDGENGDTYTSRDQSLTNEISQVSLAPGASTEVYVRISYADNGHYVDGNMTVNFGYIMLQYRSVDSPSSIPSPVVEISPVAGTYTAYIGSMITEIQANNDGSATIEMNGVLTPATYEYNNQNNIITVTIGGDPAQFNYANVNGNKIIHSTLGGNAMVWTTNGTTGITPLSGLTYVERNAGNESITFNSDGSFTYTYGNDGFSGEYAVIDDLFYVADDGGSIVYQISSDYSTLYFSEQIFDRQN